MADALLAFAIFLGLLVAMVLGSLVTAAMGAVAAFGVVLVKCVTSARAAFQADADTAHLTIDPPAPGEPGEPAFRTYLFGPVLQDYLVAVRSAAQDAWTSVYRGPGKDENATYDDLRAQYPGLTFPTSRPLVGWIIDAGTGPRRWLPRVPEGATLLPTWAALVGTVAGFAAAAALAALTTVVFGLLLAAYLAAAGSGALLLRGFEVAVLRVRGITIECVNCGRRIGVPAYDCDKCIEDPPARHRRLLPGMHGVLARTCRCHHQLPTLLLRGRADLAAFCSHEDCQYPLPAKGLTAPTFHVPVVAGRSAGKSVLMLSMISDLNRSGRLEFADVHAQADYDLAKQGLCTADFGGVAATAPELQLRGVTFYLDDPAPRRLLYLYDAAGETFESGDAVDRFRFIGSTAGVVLVVDPFALDSVRGAVPPDCLAAVRPSEVAPHDVAQRFAAGLRTDSHIGAGRQLRRPVAVVVTKVDMLVTAGLAHPYEGGAESREDRSQAVRTWLCDQTDGTALTSGAEASFSRVGYFAVSGLDAFGLVDHANDRTGTAVRNDEISEPLRWLLQARGRRP